MTWARDTADSMVIGLFRSFGTGAGSTPPSLSRDRRQPGIEIPRPILVHLEAGCRIGCRNVREDFGRAGASWPDRSVSPAAVDTRFSGCMSSSQSQFAFLHDRATAGAIAEMALILLVLLPVRALALDPSKSVTQYRLDTWGSKDGLPPFSNSATSECG